MSMQQRDNNSSEPSRRSFLKATTMTAAGLAMAGGSKAAWAQERAGPAMMNRKTRLYWICYGHPDISHLKPWNGNGANM